MNPSLYLTHTPTLTVQQSTLTLQQQFLCKKQSYVRNKRERERGEIKKKSISRYVQRTKENDRKANVRVGYELGGCGLQMGGVDDSLSLSR